MEDSIEHFLHFSSLSQVLLHTIKVAQTLKKVFPNVPNNKFLMQWVQKKKIQFSVTRALLKLPFQMKY